MVGVVFAYRVSDPERYGVAGQFIQVIEERQGLKIGCIEELAWEKGFIDDNQLRKLGEKYIKSGYGAYLLNRLK
ncbi:unnamed protein product [Bathycoccus prasinos]